MSAAWKIFFVGLGQVLRDGMLLILLPAPFLLGAALRFIVPLADHVLVQELSFSLVPWYPLSDAFVMSMTPIMIGMVCAFIILDERDEGLGIYYNITPSGGRAYLVARIGLPMVWAFVSSVLVVFLFGIALVDFFVIMTVAVIGTLQGIVSCMLLVTLAGNKVEGLALAKLTNLITLGLPAVWFITAPYSYLLSFLPSFWIGKLIQVANGQSFSTVSLYGLVGVVCALLWISALQRIFVSRAI